MSKVVVGLFISDRRFLLLEEDLIWAQRLLGSFGVLDVANDASQCDSPFGGISSHILSQMFSRNYLPATAS